MAQFMEDHPREKEEKGEKRGLIVVSRNKKPQAVEMLTQPTLGPRQEQQGDYKPKKSPLRRTDLSSPRKC
jgi:hypothetical protein